MKKLALIILPVALFAVSQLVACEEKTDTAHDHDDTAHEDQSFCSIIFTEYLSFKTRQIGKPVRFVELAQEINNSMPTYVVNRVSDLLNSKDKILRNSKRQTIQLLGCHSDMF